ncbi:MAG: Ig-like domain-containing protein [Thermoanaerobaculia bacterium]
MSKQVSRPNRLGDMQGRLAWLAAGLLSLVLSPAMPAGAAWRYQELTSVANATPPLPPTSLFPVQLLVDDDAADGAVGVAGQGARQFLWFNRFTPGVPFDLQEVWVLFPGGSNMAVGNAVQIAIYQDTDGNPANGAALLSSFNTTVQAVDGNTFSVYSLASPVAFNGVGDLLIGVIPRFIVSNVTSPTLPAAIDTSGSQSRSWLASWVNDPPDPPVLMPPPDQQIVLVDTVQAGNWMIRGFGMPPAGLGVPTLDRLGLLLLGTLLFFAALIALRRRRAALVLIFLCLASAFAAGTAQAQTTIDTFTTNQATLTDPPGGSSTATGGADIIGTRRGLVVDNLMGAGPTSVGVTGGALTLTVANTTPDSRGEAQITWDGDTNPTTLSPTGLGGVNLTTGGASGFRIRVNSSTPANNEIELIVYSSATNFSRASLLLPSVGAAQNFFIAFSEFTVTGGTGASFSSVGAIQMVVRTQEGTLALDEVVAALPALAATKVDALTNDVDLDTRADPGDTLTYTITITNNGSEAATVNLSDVVDANTTLVAGSTSSTPFARNDQYTGIGNVTLSIDGSPGKPGLLANDGDPDGDPISVTAIDATSAQGGTVTLVNASTGTFTYSPPSGFRGVDSFNYTIQDNDAHSVSGQARITLTGRVWFVDDSNTTAPFLGTLADPFQSLAAVNGAGGAGDADDVGDTIFVFDDDGTPYAGGLELEANETLIGEAEGLVIGGVTIVPAGGRPQITHAAGHGITLSTNNTIRGLEVMNAAGAGIRGTGFGTLTITNSLVSTAAGAAVDLTNGTLAVTLASVSSAGTAAQRGINLDTVSGTFTVTAATSLIDPTGQGIRVASSPGLVASFGATNVTDNAIGTAPAATAVDLATGNAGATFNFTSLNVTPDGAGLLANNSGTINIGGTSNSIVANGGPALDVTSTSLGSGASFTTVSSMNSTGRGVNLDTVSGSFSATAGTISSAAQQSFRVNAGNSAVSYGGAVTNTAAARLIEVTNRTGGAITFSGNLSGTGSSTGILVQNNATSGTPSVTFSGGTKNFSTGASPAITLDNNDVATVTFSGGGLTVATTSGAAFNVINGAAAVNVTGSGNTLASTTGTALNVASSNIGASGLTFRSISSNGAASGISLTSTGSSGGLTVTGTGSAGSGGTIQSSTGPGILLSNTRDVSLASMNVQNGGDDGIRGTSVVNFSLSGSSIATNGNATTEHGLDFTELTGTASITSTSVTGSAEHDLSVVNSTGTLSSFNISGAGCQFSNTSATTGSDGILFQGNSTANMTINVSGCTFANNRGDHFQATTDGASSATMDVTLSGNTMTGAAGNLGAGITINPANSANMAFNLLNNNMTGSVVSAITLVLQNSAVGGSLHGTVSGNQIGNAGVLDSGSSQGSGISIIGEGAGTLTVAVTNNAVRQYSNPFGIQVEARGSTNVNATVTGNTVSNPGTFAANGIFSQAGTLTGDTANLCLDLGGAGGLANSATGSGAGGSTDLRVRHRFGTTVRLRGYTGAPTDTALVNVYLSGRNGGASASSTVNITAPVGGQFLNTTGPGGPCPLP